MLMISLLQASNLRFLVSGMVCSMIQMNLIRWGWGEGGGELDINHEVRMVQID